MKCELCDSSDEGLIYETKNWKIFLDYDQSYLGRCFIALKRHCGDLIELKKEEWLELSEIIKNLESAIQKSFDATMFNLTCLMNNAYKEKHPDPHVHWHLRPRYNHLVKFAGKIFEDKEFAHHYDKIRKLEVDSKTSEEIIKKIRANLS